MIPNDERLTVCSNHVAIMSQLPAVVDIVAQAVESAVITGQTMTKLIDSTKTLFGRLPSDTPQQLLATLPEVRRATFSKQFQ